MKKLTRIIALMLCVVILLAACGSNPKVDTDTPGDSETISERKTNSDSFTYALRNGPERLDPQFNVSVFGTTCLKPIYETLIYKNIETGEFEPYLATEWEYLEDNTTLRVKLRDDVYFHNGDKMTADDVKYSIERVTTHPATATLYGAFDGEKTEVIDENTVDIKLKYQFAPAISYLAMIRASIVSKDYTENISAEEFGMEPMGTGPFKFLDWVVGDRITYERNEEYWGDKPEYKDLTIRIIPENTTRFIELETGNIDGADAIDGADIDRIRNGQTKNIDLYTGEGLKLYYWIMWDGDEAFKDIRVRKAIAHALDQQTIIDVSYGSSAVFSDSTIASKVFGYKAQPSYEYNPELSKELLKEAGYENGLDFLVCSETNQPHIRALEAAQSMLGKVGISLKIETHDTSIYQQMDQEKKIHFMLGNLTAISGDPDQTYSRMYSTGPWTESSQDPKINELLEAGRKEIDIEKRKAIYAELQEYIYENVIKIPLLELVTGYAVRDYVEYFPGDPANSPELAKITFKK